MSRWRPIPRGFSNPIDPKRTQNPEVSIHELHVGHVSLSIQGGFFLDIPGSEASCDHFIARDEIRAYANLGKPERKARLNPLFLSRKSCCGKIVAGHWHNTGTGKLSKPPGIDSRHCKGSVDIPALGHPNVGGAPGGPREDLEREVDVSTEQSCKPEYLHLPEDRRLQEACGEGGDRVMWRRWPRRACGVGLVR